MSVAQKVKQIIVEQLGVDEAQVDDTASFVDDLGADSLDIVELVMAFEEAFDIDIPGRRCRKDRNSKRRRQLHREQSQEVVPPTEPPICPEESSSPVSACYLLSGPAPKRHGAR